MTAASTLEATLLLYNVIVARFHFKALMKALLLALSVRSDWFIKGALSAHSRWKGGVTHQLLRTTQMSLLYVSAGSKFA